MTKGHSSRARRRERTRGQPLSMYTHTTRDTHRKRERKRNIYFRMRIGHAHDHPPTHAHPESSYSSPYIHAHKALTGGDDATQWRADLFPYRSVIIVQSVRAVGRANHEGALEVKQTLDTSSMVGLRHGLRVDDGAKGNVCKSSHGRRRIWVPETKPCGLLRRNFLRRDCRRHDRCAHCHNDCRQSLYFRHHTKILRRLV